MVPVLVRLVFLIPSLPGDGGAAVDHVLPAAVAVGGHQGERLAFRPVIEHGLHEVLRGVNRASHPAFLEVGEDARTLVGRHEAEGEREEIRVDGAVIRADAIAVEAGLLVEKDFLEHRAGFRVALAVGLRLLRFPEGVGELRHVRDGLEVEGVHYAVRVRELEAVALGVRPVHDVALLDLRGVAGDQAIGADALHQDALLEFFVTGREPIRVAGAHPLGLRHEDEVRRPLGGPGAVFDQVIEGVAGEEDVVVGGVVAELVQVGIRLVGDALAVAIHVNAGEGGGLDGVFAEFPDAVERFVGGLEMGGGVIPVGGKGGSTDEVLGFRIAGETLDLDPAERGDHTPFLRGEDGGGIEAMALLGVFLVSRGSHDKRLAALPFPRGHGIAHGAGRLAVDAALLESFAEVDFEIALCAGWRGDLDVSERDLSEIDEDDAGYRGGDGDGRFLNELYGSGGGEAGQRQGGDDGFHGGRYFRASASSAFSLATSSGCSLETSVFSSGSDFRS